MWQTGTVSRAPGALAFAALVALGAALPSPALAANKDIERLQIQMASVQGQLAEVARLNDEALKELRRLNELLAEQNAQVRRGLQDSRTQEESILNALKDLTERVSELGERMQQQAAAFAGPPPAGDPAPAAAAGTPPGSQPAGDLGPAGAGNAAAAAPPPRELYSQAYADYARGNYDLAVQGFQEYLRSYPATDFSDNAQYWIGECMYGKQRYGEAIEAWNTLLRDYPSSDKLPDARVKKGMALERLGRRSQALLEYRYVVDRYPNSSAARIAREKLNPN